MFSKFCSVVVPVYNSTESLVHLASRVRAVFQKMKQSYEILFINDCSPDPDTEKVLNELEKRDKAIRVFHLSRNFGQHNALMCGFHQCRGELVVTMDDDLQHAPEDIPGMIARLFADDLDLVIGKYDVKKHHFFRNLGSRLNMLLSTKTLGIPKGLHLTSFRVFRAYLLPHLTRFQQANPKVDYLLLKLTRRYGNCPISHHERLVGKSGYTLRKLIKSMLDNVLNYSTWPLRTVSSLGLFFAFIGFVFGTFFLIRYLAGYTGVSGFTTIVLLITFFSGCILTSLGVIGEYLIRIFQSTYKNPQFVVRDRPQERKPPMKKRSGRS